MADFTKGTLVNLIVKEETKNQSTGEVYDASCTAQLLSKAGGRFSLESFYFDFAKRDELQGLLGAEIMVPVTVRQNRQTKAIAKYVINEEPIVRLGDGALVVTERAASANRQHQARQQAAAE